MKHLKTYERSFRRKYKQKYEIGDYVYINVKSPYDPPIIGEILGYDKDNDSYTTYMFRIEKIFNLDPKVILRKLNTKESEEIKIEQDAKKYNL